MRRLALTFAALLTLTCVPGTAPRSPAVVVRSESGTCGGVLIGARLVLTAGHCVNWSVGARATVDGRTEAVALQASFANDLALLVIGGDVDAPDVPVRAGVPGERVYAVSPVYRATASGVLERTAFVGPAMATYWETTLTIAPGWSGSPVFAERDGALLGVVSSCQGTEEWRGASRVKSCLPGFAIVAGFTLAF